MEGNQKTETIAFDLLESKENKESDILNCGGQILEELAKLKTDLATIDIGDILEKWSATFDENLKDYINKCCFIKNPFDANGNLPINDEETSPNSLEEADLLNESLSVYDGDYLASLSPGKRQSIAQPAAEFKRMSFMPAK